MTHRPMDLDETLDRWRVAKRLCLGLIVMLGSLTATIALGQRALFDQQRAMTCHRTAQTETFGGVGILISPHPHGVFIEGVLPNLPADGVIQPGAVILAVDGVTPTNINEWTRNIRGRAGESVELRVAQPDGAIETLSIERELIHRAQPALPALWR